MRFSFTFLWVPDVAKAMAFYERAFGLPVRTPPQAGEWGLLGDPGHPLGFEAHHVAPQRARGAFEDRYVRGQPAGFYLVHDVPELEPALHRAVSAGCTVLSGPEVTPVQNYVAWVVDPYGIVVELLQHAPRRPPTSRIEKALAAAGALLLLASLAIPVIALATPVLVRTPLAVALSVVPLMGWCGWLGVLAGAWSSRAWRWRRPLMMVMGIGALAAIGLAGFIARFILP